MVGSEQIGIDEENGRNLSDRDRSKVEVDNLWPLKVNIQLCPFHISINNGVREKCRYLLTA